MAVIRQDTVKIDFNVDTRGLTIANDLLKDFQKNLTGTVTNNVNTLQKGFSNIQIPASLQTSINNASNGLTNLNTSLTKFQNQSKNIPNTSSGLDTFNAKAKSVGETLKDLGSKALDLTKTIAKIGAVAVTSGSALTAMLTKKAVSNFADFEQLEGGVKKLFGDAQDIVFDNAANAYINAGLSANDYMETVTNFSASLISGLGNDTVKAAQLADMAVNDMSDNANTFGTDISSIQDAYQGFAKQNYTMLDNLKLGYGGTQEEMARLVRESGVLGDAGNALTADNLKELASFDKIVEAIHTVQEEMLITGTTANEANGTIQGSVAAMKAAWKNLTVGMADGNQDFSTLANNFATTAITAYKNIAPRIKQSISGIGLLVETLAPEIEKEIPDLIDEILPSTITALTSLIKSLASSFPTLIKTLKDTIIANKGTIVEGISEIGAELVSGLYEILTGSELPTEKFDDLKKSIQDALKGIGTAIQGAKPLLDGLVNSIIWLGTNITWVVPLIASLWGAFKGIKVVTTLLSAFNGAGAGKATSGIGKIFKSIADIDVKTVGKAMLNIGIIIGGISALYLLIGAISLIDFDIGKITQIIGLIGLIGVVGGALSAIAGLIGKIPVDAVLLGLGYIALAINALGLVIAEFGALAQIPGINEFMTQGGDLLATIFEQLGKIVGSLIGGVGEGITNSLPKIGENISKFGEALTPFFTSLQGVDLAGTGEFLSSFGDFLLGTSVDKIAEKFAGETNFDGLAKNLPLLGQAVTEFCQATASIEIPEKMTEIFKALSEIGSLPNTGGFMGFWNGEKNFEGVAQNLVPLGQSMSEFYQSISTIDNPGKISEMFGVISEMNSLPNTGGVVQWWNGENGLSTLGGQLKDFGDSLVYFSEKIAQIDISNLSNTASTATGIISNSTETMQRLVVTFLAELEASARQTEYNITTILSEGCKTAIDTTDTCFDSIVVKATQLPIAIGEAIKSSGSYISAALSTVWADAERSSANSINQIVSGANWILGEFGSEKRITPLNSYANGTNAHKGGNALVNDGRGAELIRLPNGQVFLPKGKNVLIPNAPKGMQVLSAEQTASLMGKSSPTYSYADGTGDDVFSFFGNSQGLVDKVKGKFVSYDGLSGLALEMSKGVVNIATGAMGEWINKLFDEFGAKSLASYVASAGVEQWRSTVIQALQMEGQYSEANVERTLYQMQTESGGNPMAINLWDSNAMAGIPSKGLMQCIDPTFNTYARPGYNSNIYDPLSNILASIRYAISRYGSLANAYQGHGYANGGIATSPSIFGEDGAEMAIPLSPDKKDIATKLWAETGSILGYEAPVSNATYEETNYSPVFNITINGDISSREKARETKKQITEVLDEYFENLARRHSVVRQV